MELKKGKTIMTDAALHLPASFLNEAFNNRSGVPLEHFELYYCGKRLEGEAALASWGVEKGSTIEVKMRGRGGMPTGDEACELSQTSPSLGAGRVTAIYTPQRHTGCARCRRCGKGETQHTGQQKNRAGGKCKADG